MGVFAMGAAFTRAGEIECGMRIIGEVAGATGGV
jgi:hypothetical protein